MIVIPDKKHGVQEQDIPSESAVSLKMKRVGTIHTPTSTYLLKCVGVGVGKRG